MSRAVAMRRLFVSAVAVAALWLGLLGCRADDGPRPPSNAGPIKLRGVWVQGQSLQTKEHIDAILDRAQAGRFNAIFVGVFGDGRTVYPSRLTDQKEKIRPGFDPHPEVIVSATITSDQKQAAQENFQDWRAWLKNGTIDVLIPRAYVNDVESLPAVLETWQPAVQEYGRVVFGVIDFVANGASDEPKPPNRLLAEIEMAQAAGTNGIMIFDLDRLSDEQLQALAAGPFAALTQAIGK